MKILRKIKVVHIISNLSIGGAQLLLFDIAKCLSMKDDIELTVITIDQGIYKKKFEAAGINVIALNQKGLINFRVSGMVKKILREINPDIVHTHLHKADFYGRIAAKLANVPVIISTCHNYSSHHGGANLEKKSVFDMIDNIVIKFTSSRLVAISKIVRQYLINRNKNFEPFIEIIYNGIDISKSKYKLGKDELVEFRVQHNMDANNFIILLAGRLEKQKGYNFFLNAASEFIKKNKRVKVLILGEGNIRAEIENQINELSLINQVSLIGFLPDIEKYIEISDLVCVPSLWEAFGLVILEAMIKKKIVLASNTGGIPEIIEENKTGFLFESENPESLINKLSYIYENIENFNNVKDNALEQLKTKFDISKNSELYYKYYLKLLNI